MVNLSIYYLSFGAGASTGACEGGAFVWSGARPLPQCGDLRVWVRAAAGTQSP